MEIGAEVVPEQRRTNAKDITIMQCRCCLWYVCWEVEEGYTKATTRKERARQRTLMPQFKLTSQVLLQVGVRTVLCIL